MNETLNLGKPLIDFMKETMEYILKEPLKQSFVYYLSIWFVAKHSTNYHGLSKNFDKVYFLLIKLNIFIGSGNLVKLFV